MVSFDINENVNIDEAPTEEDIDDEGAISNVSLIFGSKYLLHI